MDYVVEALRQHELLMRAWRAVVWVAAVYLFVLGALSLIRPAVVHRFFDGFVSSRGVNFLEASLRVIAGLAFMGVSPDTKLPEAFFWIGFVLVATSVPMMFLYRFHKRQAAWAVPFAKRILPLMGLVSLAMSGLVVWALY